MSFCFAHAVLAAFGLNLIYLFIYLSTWRLLDVLFTILAQLKNIKLHNLEKP